MTTEITMPRLSDTMDSGTIAKWLKHEGDQISKGDIIAEIETDKANMEMEAFQGGVLARILVNEGQSAPLGAPIAVLAANEEEAKSVAGEQVAAPAGKDEQSVPEDEAPVPTQPRPGEPAPEPSAAAPVRAEAAPEQESRTEAAPAGQAGPNGRIKASPLARRMAQEQGINLVEVTGTGPGGRITKEDVLAFVKQAPSARPAEQPAAPAEQPAPQPVSASGLRAPQPVEMSRMHQTIARRMTEARFSAPDFVLTAELDLTEARRLLQSIAATEGAPKVGPNDLLIKAVATALTQHPEVNGGWENGTAVRYGRVNVGNAVAIPGGLVVPVIKDVDQKSLGQIARESKELIEKARSNKLAPSEYEGGTFTISNLGMYGIDQFTPIINVPEACIMGVGQIATKPVVVDGAVVVRDRMRVDLACDHRVINGAQGAEFVRTLRQLLENPMLIML